jgi:hypothetical protein
MVHVKKLKWLFHFKVQQTVEDENTKIDSFERTPHSCELRVGSEAGARFPGFYEAIETEKHNGK